MIRDSLLHHILGDIKGLVQGDVRSIQINKNFRISSVSVFGKWRFRIIFLPDCLLAYITIEGC